MKIAFRRLNSMSVWWMNPLVPVVLTLLPVSLCALLIPDGDYRHFWHVTKYFSNDDLGLMVLIVVAFSIGSFAASAWKGTRGSQVVQNVEELPWAMVFRFFQAGFLLTVVGYLIWLGLCFKNGLSPSLLVSVLKGEGGAIFVTRNIGILAMIPGVTTMAQFEAAVCVLGVLVGWRFGWRKTGWHLGIVVFMAIVRAVFFCERLAFIECVLPASLLFIRLNLGDQPSAKLRRLWTFLPAAALVGMLGLFTVTEYLRSWANVAIDQTDSVVWHSFMRFVGYYTTALNNGARLLDAIGELQFPFHTVEAFWKFPLLGVFVKGVRNYLDDNNDKWALILQQDLNMEFNNASGTFVTFSDYGYLGAIILWVFTGAIATALYKSFRRGRAEGLLIYPFFFIGIMEISRIYYWGSSRAFPSWMLLLGVLALARLRSQPAKNRVTPSMAAPAVNS